MPCGFGLRNWWITRAALRTGSTNDGEAADSALLTPFPLPPTAGDQTVADLLVSENFLIIWRDTLGAVSVPCAVLYATIRLKCFTPTRIH